MKLIAQLLLISLVALALSSSLNSLKKNLKSLQAKTKCPNIFLGGKKAEATETTNYFPEDYYADKPTVKANAKKQTEAARALLSTPKGEVLNQLKLIASNVFKMNSNKLATYWQDLQNMEMNAIMNKDVNRQLLTGILKEGTKIKQMLAVIGRVQNGIGDGNDNAAFLGLLGDIGGLIFQTSAKPSRLEPDTQDSEEVKKEKERKKKMLEGVASFKFPGAAKSAVEALFKKVAPCSAKLSVLYSTKGKERGNCIKADLWTGANINPRKDTMLDARKGLLNLAQDTLINPVSWPWQTLPKTTMDKCKDEPFTGHFSGSIVELLFILDYLSWDSSSKIEDQAQPDLYVTQVKKTAGLDSKERKARAALATSFLLGLGMHSAVEVAPAIRHYLGQSPPTIPIQNADSITATYCGQTDYISELISSSNK